MHQQGATGVSNATAQIEQVQDKKKNSNGTAKKYY